jgi:hypothetical protein
MALNAMQKEGSKGSLRGKFKRAGWDDAYLTKVLKTVLKCDCPGRLQPPEKGHIYKALRPGPLLISEDWKEIQL